MTPENQKKFMEWALQLLENSSVYESNTNRAIEVLRVGLGRVDEIPMWMLDIQA